MISLKRLHTVDFESIHVCKLWQKNKICHLSSVTCHLLHVTCHISSPLYTASPAMKVPGGFVMWLREVIYKVEYPFSLFWKMKTDFLVE